MSNINNCCQDTTEIRLTVDQFIVLIFKLHESKLHLNGFNRIALESLAKELQRKLFKAIHLRYEWFRPVEAKLLNESFKSDTNKVTKETATFTIPTLLKATNGIRLDENIPAFKRFLNKLLPYEKEWLIKDFFLSFMYMIGIYSFFLFTHLCFNNFQLAPCINAFTVPIFCLLVTLFCFPILYLPLFKLRSIKTSQLFKWECEISPLQRAIANELISLNKDSSEHKKNKIFELLRVNFSSISKKSKNEKYEDNMRRLLYVTMTYFAQAMHYVEQENEITRRGLAGLVWDITELMKSLNMNFYFRTRGTAGHSNIYSLFSYARELVEEDSGYEKESNCRDKRFDRKFDKEFSNKVKSLITNDPDNYYLLRSIKPKHKI